MHLHLAGEAEPRAAEPRWFPVVTYARRGADTADFFSTLPTGDLQAILRNSQTLPIENLVNRLLDKTLTRSPAILVTLREAVLALPQLIEKLRNYASAYNAWVTILDDSGKPNNGPFAASWLT